MRLQNTGRHIENEIGYGVYVWQMPNGSIVQDEDHNFFLIPGPKPGSKLARERMAALRKMAEEELGLTEGQPLYIDGNRPVTDEEYAEQKQRLLFGLVPDPLDVGSIRDERRNIK